MRVSLQLQVGVTPLFMDTLHCCGSSVVTGVEKLYLSYITVNIGNDACVVHGR